MSSSSVKQESYRPPPKTPFILVPDSNEIELVHNDPRPPKPSMPPPNSSPDAVHEFLILYFMSQSYSYRWSLLQARKFEGFDGEALHGLSEDEFFRKVGIYGQMLHGQLADARYGPFVYHVQKFENAMGWIRGFWGKGLDEEPKRRKD
ncbi:hypothetical protein XANCAGTX0491_002110 [Xanthoria calcicola]